MHVLFLAPDTKGGAGATGGDRPAPHGGEAEPANLGERALQLLKSGAARVGNGQGSGLAPASGMSRFW